MKKAIISFAILFYSFLQQGFGQTTNQNPVEKFDALLSKNAIWGASTNGIQFGILLSANGTSAGARLQVFSFLFSTNPTSIYGLWKLPPGFRFEQISLKSKSGEAIEKTALNLALCKTPLFGPTKGTVVVLAPAIPNEYDEVFNVCDCFKIKAPGVYDLMVKVRLYKMTSYNNFVSFDLPEAHAQVILTKSDLDY
jgi:hypothetical protein